MNHIPPRLWLDAYAGTHPSVYEALAPHLHPAEWCKPVVVVDNADFDVLAIAALIVMECGSPKPLRIKLTSTGRLGIAVNFVANIAEIAGFRVRVLGEDASTRELVFRLDRRAVAA